MNIYLNKYLNKVSKAHQIVGLSCAIITICLVIACCVFLPKTIINNCEAYSIESSINASICESVSEAKKLSAEQFWETYVPLHRTQEEIDADKTIYNEYCLSPEVGALYYNDHKETYYSQNVLPGDFLDIPGRHVCETDGTVRDADGYICVACDYDFLGYGEIVETSLGWGKVYDTGCAYGTVDIYCDW